LTFIEELVAPTTEKKKSTLNNRLKDKHRDQVRETWVIRLNSAVADASFSVGGMAVKKKAGSR
jgi:hypothetical protein